MCISSNKKTLSVEVGIDVIVPICNGRLEAELVVLGGLLTDAVTIPAHSCVSGGVVGVLSEG